MEAKMLSSADINLPYFPLPNEAINIFSKAIERRFTADHISQDHEFTARNKNGRLRVNYAVFTDNQNHDIDTSAITVYYEPNGRYSGEVIVEQIALSGSPFIFVAREKEVLPYGVNVNGKIQPIPLSEPLPYSEVVDFFDKYQSDINPNRIKNVKSGTAQFDIFKNIHSLQLRLFALEVTRNFLAEVFGNSVSQLRSEIKQPDQAVSLIDVAVQLLGSIILAHKGRLGDKYQKPNISFNDVYQQAASLFPSYFNWQAIENHLPAAERAYRVLQEATYSSFTSDMLSELYVQAYPDKRKRKLEGRYDTPLFLTRLILDNIPLETIRPDNRRIADITCGWGSFLVAGYERLSKLNDMRQLPLNSHIFGNDIDRFSAQLARVALLTTALDDNWHVTNQDALNLNQDHLKPSVIVGNPKFSGDRKSGELATEIDGISGKSSRSQEADNFLIKAIQLLEPGGYLGMLMPQSFTIGEASTNARKYLLETCDILELWDLPLSIFGKQASVSPMVVFAQKRYESGGLLKFPVRIRTSQSRSFENERQFTTSNLASSQGNWGKTNIKASQTGAKVTHLITYTTILDEKKWKSIQDNSIKIAEVAEIVSGAIIGTKRSWADYHYPKRVPWLSGAKNSIPRSFFINYESKTILYPNELEKPRKNKLHPNYDKEYLLASDKVLLVADPNPSWGRRTKVAIERKGYYPSNHFWVIAPNKDSKELVSLEVLAAVLSWDVSNAWIVESFRYPWIQSRILDDIPFPYLSEEESRDIKDAVNQIEAAAEVGEDNKDAQATIDVILKRAYKLDDDTFNLLRTIIDWDTKPSVESNKYNELISWFKVRGKVVEVNGDAETITLWLETVPEPYILPINSEMPGWMLRPGISFVAELSYEDLKTEHWENLNWKNIKPKKFTYLSEEELLENISIKLSQE